MGMIRMFHYSCDNLDATRECEGEMGDEWYASEAKRQALLAGWHISPTLALCGICWDRGVRFKDLA